MKKQSVALDRATRKNDVLPVCCPGVGEYVVVVTTGELDRSPPFQWLLPHFGATFITLDKGDGRPIRSTPQRLIRRPLNRYV